MTKRPDDFVRRHGAGLGLGTARVAMSEPESTIDNPKYKSTHPGKRHPITFEPLTGKVAWPHL
jgi:hypothetical protein